jgi:hypothetical protein
MKSLLSRKIWDISAFSIEKIDFFVFSKRPVKIRILTWFFGVFRQISIQTLLKTAFERKYGQ